MKLDIKKNTYKIITQAYHSRCSSWKLSSKARIALGTFQPASSKVKNENNVIRNRISDFDKRRISQPKNSINKPAINKRRLLIAAVFHFMHPVEKNSKKTSQVDKNSVSFSCQSKPVSRCCISFLHELTCQILTNHSIKIRRRAWSTRDFQGG